MLFDEGEEDCFLDFQFCDCYQQLIDVYVYFFGWWYVMFESVEEFVVDWYCFDVIMGGEFCLFDEVFVLDYGIDEFGVFGGQFEVVDVQILFFYYFWD